MLNVAKNKTSWILASLLVATASFAEHTGTSHPVPQRSNGGPSYTRRGCMTPPVQKACEQPKCAPTPCPEECPQPCPPTQLCEQPQPTCCPEWEVPLLNAGYGYPAFTNTRCAWNVFMDVSFIYWRANQDNMELGLLSVDPTVPQGNTFNRSIINADFDYKPGFKVGLGGNFGYDNWDMHSQYTWFHNTNSSSSNAPANTATEIKSILPSWGAPGGFFGTFGPLYKSVSQKWELDMDLIDLDLGRWYYVGTKLTFRPSLGLRAALIKQDVDMQYTSTTNTLKIDSETKSWGLGPKVALDANWNIGCGFRVYGNGEADLLYTRYTTLSSHLTNTDHAAFASNVYDTQDNVGTVRSHIELETGLGWGTYLNCNRWYLDFSAGYDFQVFFDQNMFRFFADTNMQGKSLNPNGNLYLQGLTMKARLDF